MMLTFFDRQIDLHINHRHLFVCLFFVTFIIWRGNCNKVLSHFLKNGIWFLPLWDNVLLRYDLGVCQHNHVRTTNYKHLSLIIWESFSTFSVFSQHSNPIYSKVTKCGLTLHCTHPFQFWFLVSDSTQIVQNILPF